MSCCRAGSTALPSPTVSRRGHSPASSSWATECGRRASISGFHARSGRHPADRSDGRSTPNDIGDGDDWSSVDAAPAAVARERPPEPFDLDAVLSPVPCRRRSAVFSPSLAAGDAHLVLRAWSRSSGSMSRLSKRDCILRPDRTDAAALLRPMRLRSAHGIEGLRQNVGTTAGTVDRRYLQGGDGQGIDDDRRPDFAPAGRAYRCRRLIGEDAHEPVHVLAHGSMRKCGAV